jgi:hypothetical protein
MPRKAPYNPNTELTVLARQDLLERVKKELFYWNGEQVIDASVLRHHERQALRQHILKGGKVQFVRALHA